MAKKKIKYSVAERRAYWIGYGRRLEQMGCTSDYFSSLSNPARISMNEGSRAADKKAYTKRK